MFPVAQRLVLVLITVVITVTGGGRDWAGSNGRR